MDGTEPTPNDWWLKWVLTLYKTQILQQVEITALKQEINNLKSRTA